MVVLFVKLKAYNLASDECVEDIWMTYIETTGIIKTDCNIKHAAMAKLAEEYEETFGPGWKVSPNIVPSSYATEWLNAREREHIFIGGERPV